ncbi:STAS domain-containing protein [Sphingobacterium bovistauri]|uniref:STAS domain-containing protein n=1 Tax=Sphingobacterium bovistauri TaxID=2781959 RepID=A0ABS7Z5C1_9SPHI|nr:STAS domain-containing protein [Sphingobacterium bovistauri]MCA5003944.1 STAS domain-containing protein [Sphingobacterium bovistauri]
MKYTIDKHERYVVIEPLREVIDGIAANYLKGEFMLRNTAGQRNIVLDLNQVNEINEEGLRMGLLAHRLCNSIGGIFILINLNPEVAKTLKMLHLDQHFIILKSLSTAEDMIFGNELQRDLIGG